MELIPERYSYASPPASIEVATKRIEVLVSGLTKIKANLVGRTSDLDAIAYRNWRVRALRAQGYMDTERKFLLRWIRDKTREITQQKRIALVASGQCSSSDGG